MCGLYLFILVRVFSNSAVAEDPEKLQDDDVVKLLEKYVLAADFVGNPQVAQTLFDVESKMNTISSETDTNLAIFAPEGLNADDRTVLFGHKPSYIAVSNKALLFIGFIAFLTLLSSLQNGILNGLLLKPLLSTVSQTTNQPLAPILGGVTQLLGRRRKR